MSNTRPFTIEFPVLVVDSALPIGGYARHLKFEVCAESADEAAAIASEAIEVAARTSSFFKPFVFESSK